MSGVSAKCYATKWHHRCGSNRNDVDDRAKQRDLIRLCLNDREGDLANVPCLIRLCPNGHAVALVRSLEHVHRLVGFCASRDAVYVSPTQLGRIWREILGSSRLPEAERQRGQEHA